LIERLWTHPNHLSTYYPNYFDNSTLLTAGTKGYRLTVMPIRKLTAEVEVKILNHVAAGSKLIDAARDAGVTAGTARNWVKWGEEGKAPYAAFADRLRAAEAAPRNKAMQAWIAAVDNDWRAAVKFIEHSDKELHAQSSVDRQHEELLWVIEKELGEEALKKVLRAYVERTSSAETGGARTSLRLVAAE